jgi:hypothetical protein
MRLLGFCCAILLLFGCDANHTRTEFVPVTALQGKVQMQIPAAWKQDTTMKWHTNDIGVLRDAAFFGDNARTGCYLEWEALPVSEKSMAAHLKEELQTVKVKNPGVVIVVAKVDSNARTMQIDYQGKNPAGRGQRYSRKLLIMQPDQQVSFLFQGPSTSIFQQIVEQTTRSIEVD